MIIFAKTFNKVYNVANFTGCLYYSLSIFQGALLRAITDNLVHGSLAVIIWLLGYMSHVECCHNDAKSRDNVGNGLAKHTVVILQSIACGIVCCAVDLDHFIAAGSLNLQVQFILYFTRLL